MKTEKLLWRFTPVDQPEPEDRRRARDRARCAECDFCTRTAAVEEYLESTRLARILGWLLAFALGNGFWWFFLWAGTRLWK